MQTFKLIIRTPEETLFEGEAEKIHFASEGGDMEVYSHHASLTATINFTPIKVTSQDQEEFYFARNGMFIFDNDTNSAALLALHCELKSEVSHQTVKEYLEFIDQQLKEGKSLSEFQILYLEGEKLAVEEQIKSLE